MRSSQGFLLVTVLFITLIVALVALGTSFTSLIDRQTASSQRGATEAFYVAQAGADLFKTALFQELVDGFTGEGVEANVCEPPGQDQIIVGGRIIEAGAISDPFVYAPGNFTLQYEVDPPFYILTSVGTVGTARSTVQVVSTAGIGPEGVWDNAIFAATFRSSTGSGLQGGNAAVYGSMHIVEGQVELDGDFIDIDTGFIGAAGVFNNYKGLSTPTNVMSAATAALGSTRVAAALDLCARVKIHKGELSIQGNASLGAPADGNDDYVEAIEGVYLDTVSNFGSGGSANVHLRSGVNNYEGLDLPFPVVKEGVRTAYDHAVLSPDLDDCSAFFDGSGDLLLPPRGSNNNRVYQGADVTCGDGGNYLSWTSTGDTTGTLTLSGNVLVDSGDVKLGSNQLDLVYQGLGTIIVDAPPVGSTTAPTLEVNGNVTSGSSGAFLETSALGIISNGPVELNRNGRLDALVYSADRIDVNQQVTIVGALVGRSVVTAQVPKVLWHPDVGNAAVALDMPGSGSGNEGFLNDISVARQ